jgi:predicted protein tyrosine phosphatase
VRAVIETASAAESTASAIGVARTQAPCLETVTVLVEHGHRSRLRCQFQLWL